MSEFFPMAGEFFLRDKDGRTMILGVVQGKYVSAKQDEIWIGQFLPIDIVKYKAPEYLRNKRADQILCTPINIETLELLTKP